MHHAVALLDFPVDAFLHNSLAINPALNKTGLLVTGWGSERYFINYTFKANTDGPEEKHTAEVRLLWTLPVTMREVSFVMLEYEAELLELIAQIVQVYLMKW